MSEEQATIEIEKPKKLTKKQLAAQKAAELANKRKRFKLRALTEQLQRHAKKSGLQVFCMVEGDSNLQLAQVGYYSEYTAKQTIVYLATVHSVIFNDTVEQLNGLAKAAEELKAKNQEGQDNPPQEDSHAPDELSPSE